MNTSSLTHDAGHTAGQALPELIEALKKATGPSKELDRAIRNFVMGDGNELAAPDYTSSIDAAMTLVPKGWFANLSTGAVYPTGLAVKPSAELAEPIETEYGAGVGVRAQAYASNAAIALCIAALEARRQP